MKQNKQFLKKVLASCVAVYFLGASLPFAVMAQGISTPESELPAASSVAAIVESSSLEAALPSSLTSESSSLLESSSIPENTSSLSEEASSLAGESIPEVAEKSLLDILPFAVPVPTFSVSAQIIPVGGVRPGSRLTVLLQMEKANIEFDDADKLWVGYEISSADALKVVAAPNSFLQPHPPVSKWVADATTAQIQIADPSLKFPTWISLNSLDNENRFTMNFALELSGAATPGTTIQLTPYMFLNSDPSSKVLGTPIDILVADYSSIPFTESPRLFRSASAPSITGTEVAPVFDTGTNTVIATLPSTLDSEYVTVPLSQKHLDNVIHSLQGRPVYYPGTNRYFKMPYDSDSLSFFIQNETSNEYKIVGVNLNHTSIAVDGFDPMWHNNLLKTIENHPDYAQFRNDNAALVAGTDRAALLLKIYTDLAVTNSSNEVIMSGLDRLIFDTYNINGTFTNQSALNMGNELFTMANNGGTVGLQYSHGQEPSIFADAADYYANYLMFVQFGDITGTSGSIKNRAANQLIQHSVGNTTSADIVSDLGSHVSIASGSNEIPLHVALKGGFGNFVNRGSAYFDIDFQLVLKRVDKTPPSSSSKPTSSSSQPVSSSSAPSSSSPAPSSSSSAPSSSSPAPSSSSPAPSSSSSASSSSSSSSETPPTPTPTPSSSSSRPTASASSAVRPPAASSSSASRSTVAPVTSASSSSRSSGSGSGSVSAGASIVSGPSTASISDPNTPQAGLDGNKWALLNLLLAIVSFVVAVALAVVYILNQKKERSETKQVGELEQEQPADTYTRRTKLTWRILAIASGIVSPVIFLLTENMRNPMGWVDKWSILMVGITLLQVVFVVLLYKAQTYDPIEETDGQEGTSEPKE